MKLPIKYMPLPDDSQHDVRVRVFHGRSETVGHLDGFTISSDGLWVNLSKTTTYNVLAPALEPRHLSLKSIHMQDAQVMLEVHGS